MGLPKLETPVYTTKLPSTGKNVKYRPFVAREEKILMLANEGENATDRTDALQEVIRVCTFNAIKVEQLPVFDIEYLFLCMYAKAKGDKVPLKFKCERNEDTLCGTPINFSLDLSEVNVTFSDEHARTIKVNDQYTATFRYPTMEMLPEFEGVETVDAQFKMLARLLESVHDDADVYDDFTQEEAVDFIESLPDSVLRQIKEKFIDNMPKLQHTITVPCACGKKTKEVTLQGLSDFLA